MDTTKLLNMKILSFIILSLSTLTCSAGTRYFWTGATSGIIAVDGAGTGGNHSLAAGDTLDFQFAHTYAEIDFNTIIGSAPSNIVIENALLGGASAGNDGIYTNLHYVKFLNIISHNNQSTIIYARAINATAGTGVDNCTWNFCKYYNDAGSFSFQPAIVFDDRFNGSSSMYFTNNINQTFHHNTWSNCLWSGFFDVDIVRLGTDTTRSLCLNFTFDHDTASYITNVTQAPIFLNATVYKLSVHDCYFHNFMWPTPYCGSCLYNGHTGWVYLYGNGDIYNNRFDSSYADAVRAEGMQFNGLPGYMGPVRIYNNIDTRHYHYPSYEWNHNNIIAGNRIARMDGFADFNQLDCESNLTYFTYRYNVNFSYNGGLVDAFTDSITLKHNIFGAPEIDFAFDLAGRNYILINTNGFTGTAIDSSDNRVFPTWAGMQLVDSVRFMPLPGTVNYKVSTGTRISPTDKNGVVEDVVFNRGPVKTVLVIITDWWKRKRKTIFK